MSIEYRSETARWKLATVAVLAFLAAGSARAQGTVPIKVDANGVTLHAIEQGQGEPLILLHGGQGDLRSWGAQMEAFSRSYRVFSYSRRYNFPNDNEISPAYRSGYSDAEDLAALIRQLGLGRVHLVGTSAGALAALLLAMEHPEMVRTLVLAEPPVHAWARQDREASALYREFIDGIWRPAGARFRAGDEAGAMKVLVDGFGGAGRFDRLSPEGRALAMRNARFFKAATLSNDPFPEVSKEQVRQLRMPILIVTGEHTIALHRWVNGELARLLPNAEQATIPKAGHGSPRENPQAFNDAVARFLEKQRR